MFCLASARVADQVEHFASLVNLSIWAVGMGSNLETASVSEPERIEFENRENRNSEIA